MMSQMNIPEEIRAKLMEQLGVSSDHIDEALGLAQKSPNVGVTPFLQHMRAMTEYFKSFKNQQQKLEQFSNTKSVDERLRLVYQALSNSKDFSEVKELFKNKVPRNNSTDQSKQKRDIGNKFYQKKQFKEAVKAYTDSALAVTIDVNGKSREISLALGNRSAVFYQLGDHDRCLEDIEAALMFGYPEEMQYKLMDRRGRILMASGRKFEAQEALEMASLLVQKSKLSNEDKIKFKQDVKNSMVIGDNSNSESTSNISNPYKEQSYEPHPCIPGLTSKIEVVYDDKRGRHSVANHDFYPGEVVGVDNPVTWCLSYNHALTHCHHCCQPLTSSGGYPSPLSIHETILFCSLSCLHAASTTYHQHEAIIPLSYLFSIEAGSGANGRGGFDEISGAVLMAIRILTQKTPNFFTDTDWLGEAKQNHVPTEITDDDDGNYKFKSLFNMVTHHDTRSDVDLLSTTMKTVFILQMLQAMKYCSNVEDYISTLGPIIFHLLEVVQFNSHPIDIVVDDIDPNKNINLVEIGSAVYPTIATCCNHSCDPSTIRVSRGNQMTLFARRKINVGEEISDCYGFHYTSLKMAERKQRLEKWFKFLCQCDACANKYPIMANLDSKLSQNNLDLLKSLLEKFQHSLKQDEARKSLDLSIKYLESMETFKVPRPHKAWEAGSHALTCALWAVFS